MLGSDAIGRLAIAQLPDWLATFRIFVIGQGGNRQIMKMVGY